MEGGKLCGRKPRDQLTTEDLLGIPQGSGFAEAEQDQVRSE